MYADIRVRIRLVSKNVTVFSLPNQESIEFQRSAFSGHENSSPAVGGSQMFENTSDETFLLTFFSRRAKWTSEPIDEREKNFDWV